MQEHYKKYRRYPPQNRGSPTDSETCTRSRFKTDSTDYLCSYKGSAATAKATSDLKHKKYTERVHNTGAIKNLQTCTGSEPYPVSTNSLQAKERRHRQHRKRDKTPAKSKFYTDSSSAQSQDRAEYLPSGPMVILNDSVSDTEYDSIQERLDWIESPTSTEKADSVSTTTREAETRVSWKKTTYSQSSENFRN